MKYILICLVLLSGCSTGHLSNVNGGYYHADTKYCARYRPIDSQTIACFTNDDQFTGYRKALTNQELQMYMYESQDVGTPITQRQYSSCNTTGTFTHCY